MIERLQGKVLERVDEGQEIKSLLLSLEGVSVSYEGVDKPIVQNINFMLNEGESVLFLGPSGCGKSTVAMLCGGLIPQSIEAKITGNVWRKKSLSESLRIGYVFQDPEAQFCMLSVADEIAFGLENVSLQKENMDARIAKSLADVDLDVPFQANHASFSGGMKQKLAIASALALDPELIIFDEPTANLDPLSTRQVFQQIANLRKMKHTMIVIEHKFEELIQFMDKIVLFNREGRIHRIGKAREVVTKEWAWMVAEGIVEPWKLPLGEQSRNGTFPARTHSSKAHVSKETLACSLEHMTVELSKKTILNDISLDIREGEFVAVLGPNGAGKSTLLQTLAGLIKPKSGSASLFGKSTRDLNKQERLNRIAYCFQNPEFQFIYERVGDELANRRAGNDFPPEVACLLAQFGLSGTEMQSPFSLSQGQKRRLSVAAMLRDEHDIFFLDEPTFGQDASTKEAIMEQLWQLNEKGKTVVMTTHDIDLARFYATKVVVVIAGKIRFEGSFEELQKDVDLMASAHLIEAVSPSQNCGTEGLRRESFDKADLEDLMVLRDTKSSSYKHHFVPPVKLLHPGLLLIGLLVITGIMLQANTLTQSLACIVYSIVVMMGLGFMSPWKIGKLVSPFVAFYIIYIWSFAANAAIPAGDKSVHFLWMNLSLYGLNQGVILALRMLSSVLFGIFYIWNIDMSDLMVSLAKDFHIPPKFAYGTLAGLRVVPLFKSEWTKLRQARQLRGKDAKLAVFRPVIYSLPLLSQAIRMSERVAIAMEARGFIGRPAATGKGRTYYRKVSVHGWDYFAQLILIVCAIFTLWIFR